MYLHVLIYEEFTVLFLVCVVCRELLKYAYMFMEKKIHQHWKRRQMYCWLKTNRLLSRKLLWV